MKLKSHFERLNKLLPQYNSHQQVDLMKENYIPLVKAAFAKCLEFNLFLQRLRSTKNAFFFQPFLRGICEDLITLKYLGKYFKEDRDELCALYVHFLLIDSVQSQHVFFTKRKLAQAYVSHPNAQKLIDNYKIDLSALMEKHKQRKGKIFPSTEHMAIDAGLKDLYDFLYHATSRTVHFSPNILLRMGWYVKDGPFVFSSHNFDRYYHEFNLFYAAYLFVEFCKSFKDTLGLKPDFLDEVKQISGNINTLTYHPELVTFQELNMKVPDASFRYILAALIENSKKKASAKKKAPKKPHE